MTTASLQGIVVTASMTPAFALMRIQILLTTMTEKVTCPRVSRAAEKQEGEAVVSHSVTQTNMFEMNESDIERERKRSKLFAEGCVKLIEAGVHITMTYPDGVEVNVASVTYETRESPGCKGKFLQIHPQPAEILAGHPPLIVDMTGMQASLTIFNKGISFSY
jgi:hypothetical protein